MEENIFNKVKAKQKYPSRILITMGDPAGIGPYISVKALSKSLKYLKPEVTLIGDSFILKRISGFSAIKKKIRLIDLNNASGVKSGYASKLSGQASLEYIKEAVAILKRNPFIPLVTAPVCKEAIQLIHKDFTGHTEYLAEAFSVKKFAMMMVGHLFKIVFFSRHILIRDLTFSLKKKEMKDTIDLTISYLSSKFKIKKPRLAFCSLNPHAGINTYLEKEERLLVSILKGIKKGNLSIIGPYPPDVIFREALKKRFDVIFVFYHDQGMIPFRMLDFTRGVNLTLGLPFIRTSPAHGVGFDLIRNRKRINVLPMLEAINLALRVS